MPLKIYDTKDAVPEAQRAAALETKDGKFAIAEDPDVTNLKSALDAERKKAEDAEKARKAAEDKAAALERDRKAKDSGISDEELQKIRDAEAAARKPIEEERDRLKTENRKLKLTDRVKSLALGAGIMEDRIDDAMVLLESRTDLTDKDTIVVKDKSGTVTTESIDDFLKVTFKKEKKYLYKGTGAAGSESTGSDGAGGDGYDPAKAGKDAAAAQRKSNEATSLAFK